jgi:hypothetical protein
MTNQTNDSERPQQWALYGLINQRVGTTRGPGVLWQAFPSSDQLGVVLDADPSVVTFMRLSEFMGPEGERSAA